VKKTLTLLGLLVAASTTVFLGCSSTATAADTIPVSSKCHVGWYVNADEGDLLPEQVETGFLFDGPSLVHHATKELYLLKDTPTNGSFVAEVQVGVRPLFKMETTAPYSTINKTTAGKFWSSKILTGPGSQALPVATIAELAAIAPYTEATKVYSFGVGYAKDIGNKAVVSSIKFGTTEYILACKPKPSASASPSVSSTSPTGTPGVVYETCADAPHKLYRGVDAGYRPELDSDGDGVACEDRPEKPVQSGALPVTGPARVAIIAASGAAAVLGGVLLVVLGRRRRIKNVTS
jgi:LPXTG-motif cell wall-anchored protein